MTMSSFSQAVISIDYDIPISTNQTINNGITSFRIVYISV